MVQDRCGDRPEQQDVRLVEGRLGRIAVDVAIGADEHAAHAIHRLDPGHQLARQLRTEDGCGEDGR